MVIYELFYAFKYSIPIGIENNLTWDYFRLTLDQDLAFVNSVSGSEALYYSA